MPEFRGQDRLLLGRHQERILSKRNGGPWTALHLAKGPSPGVKDLEQLLSILANRLVDEVVKALVATRNRLNQLVGKSDLTFQIVMPSGRFQGHLENPSQVMREHDRSVGRIDGTSDCPSVILRE